MVPGSIPCQPRFPCAGWVSTEAKKDPGGLRPPRGHPEATLRPSGGQPIGTLKPPRGYPEAYSPPRVIHRSEESPEGLLPAGSVNNSAARKVFLGMNAYTLSPHRENTHRPATNTEASQPLTQGSPSSRATRWSLTNTQWRTAWLSRSHYKPFAGISQRVFRNL